MTKGYTKFAWLGMILMAIDLFLLGETGIHFSAAIGSEETFKLVDLGMGEIITIIRYVKIAAIVCALCLVLATQTLSKKLYAPMAAAGIIGLIGVVCLILMKRNLIAASGLEEIMGLFSIECKVNGAVWGFAVTSAVEMVCGIVPFLKKA